MQKAVISIQCIRLVLAMILQCALATPTVAQSDDADDPSLDIQFIQDIYAAQQEQAAKPLTELKNKYRQALLKYRDDCQAAGKLDGVVEATKALDHEEEALIPDGQSLDPMVAKYESIYLKSLPDVEKVVRMPRRNADREYLVSLDDLQKRLTKEGKIKAAVKVRDTLEEGRLRIKIPGAWDVFRGPKADGVRIMTMMLLPNGQGNIVGETTVGTWVHSGKVMSVDWGPKGKQTWTLTGDDIVQGSQYGAQICMKRSKDAATTTPPLAFSKKTGPAAAPVIKVLSATYGSGGKNADVTEKVTSFVESKRAFSASPRDLGADPTPGWNKSLVVKFLKDGIKRELSRGEGGVVIPENFTGPQDAAELEAFLAGTRWKADVEIQFNSDKTITIANRLGTARWQIMDDNRKFTMIWSDEEMTECDFDATWSTFHEKEGKKRDFKKLK